MLAYALRAWNGCATEDAPSFGGRKLIWAERCTSDCLSDKVLVSAIEQGDDGVGCVESV